jgi:hypothetical protein
MNHVAIVIRRATQLDQHAVPASVRSAMGKIFRVGQTPALGTQLISKGDAT